MSEPLKDHVQRLIDQDARPVGPCHTHRLTPEPLTEEELGKLMNALWPKEDQQ